MVDFLLPEKKNLELRIRNKEEKESIKTLKKEFFHLSLCFLNKQHYAIQGGPSTEISAPAKGLLGGWLRGVF